MNNALKFKNILHIIDATRFGGAQKIAFEISNYSQSTNNKFHFLLINRSDRKHQMVRLLEKSGIPFVESNTYNVRQIPSFRIARFIEAWQVAIHFIKAVVKFNISLVHIHIYQFFYLIPLFQLLRIFNLRFIWTLHGDVNYSIAVRRKINKLLKKMKNKNNWVQITQVSEHINRDLSAMWVNEGINQLVIANGIDLNKLSFSAQARKTLRDQMDITEKDILIGTVGRIEHEKGIDILINAFERLSEKKNIKLVIIGDGSLFEDFQALIKSKLLGENVFLVGAKNNIPEWLSAFDVYVQSSRAEGLSLAILEALAVGLAIVATDVGGTMDLLDNGQAGILVPPDSPEELAKAIQQLVDEKETRETLASKAVEQAQKFSLNKMLESYQEIYQSIC
ncbi:MAG: glycosyltransferase family 4 protein [Candidatus Helarchaeota archaeon]